MYSSLFSCIYKKYFNNQIFIENVSDHIYKIL